MFELASPVLCDQLESNQYSLIRRDGNNFYITSSAIRRAIKVYTDQSPQLRSYAESTLGVLTQDRASPSLLKVSFFRTKDETGNQQESNLRRSHPSLGVFEQRTLYPIKLLVGEVHLENGGLYPSVTTHFILSQALTCLFAEQDKTVRRGDIRNIRVRRGGLDTGQLSEIDLALRDCVNRFIQAVVGNSTLLSTIEWRDFERMMALAFEELGFEVTLTQGAQDGGKDLILECLSTERIDEGFERKRYIVELKHWTRPVGTGPIKKLTQIVAKDGADGGFLYATSGFTAYTEPQQYEENVAQRGLSSIHKLLRSSKVSQNDGQRLGETTFTTLEEVLHVDLVD